MSNNIAVEDVILPLRECLAYHEAFRKLGFSSDDIYFMCEDKPSSGLYRRIWMVLKSEEKEFICAAGEVLGNPGDIRDEWCRVSEWWNETTDANRRTIWVNSHVFSTKFDFTMALIRKGFTLFDKGFGLESDGGVKSHSLIGLTSRSSSETKS